jgi:hypothetical protein
MSADVIEGRQSRRASMAHPAAFRKGRANDSFNNPDARSFE